MKSCGVMKGLWRDSAINPSGSWRRSAAMVPLRPVVSRLPVRSVPETVPADARVSPAKSYIKAVPPASPAPQPPTAALAPTRPPQPASTRKREAGADGDEWCAFGPPIGFHRWTDRRAAIPLGPRDPQLYLSGT